jgi:hypothetical protein
MVVLDWFDSLYLQRNGWRKYELGVLVLDKYNESERLVEDWQSEA